MQLPTSLLLWFLILGAAPAAGSEFATTIPMRSAGAATYYVKAEAGGLDEMEFMVDTGSGFLTINESTLADLERSKQARYTRHLQGVLADGSELVVPVYRVSRFNIGGDCVLHNVEAAVFPGKTRQILGLNALKRASPFIFSVDPPELVLSHCTRSEAVAEGLTK